MADYLFNPESTFLNKMFLEGTGNPAVSPELRQIIAQNQTRDAMRDLVRLEGASIHGQQLALQLQQQTNQELSELNQNVVDLGDGIQDGMYHLADGISQGFGDLGTRVDHLAENVEEGFTQIGLGLQTGFSAVVTSLHHVDQRLGARIVGGFSLLSGQLAGQHEELTGTLQTGFSDLHEIIDSTRRDVVDGLHVAAGAIIEAHRDDTDLIIDSQHRSTEAILAALRLQTEQMAEMNRNLRSQASNEAEEHFLVGMRFFNRKDLPRAHQQFAKARECYAGHYPTLLADGVCCRVLGRLDDAQDAFESALSQVSPDGTQARRQRSIAALYLARMAFDRRDFTSASRFYDEAWNNNRHLTVALAEAALTLLLDPSRTIKAADGVAIKKRFNEQGPEEAASLWYMLASGLATQSPDFAIEAFRHAIHIDPAGTRQNRVSVIARIWRLNPRTAGTLLNLVEKDFPWMNK